MLSKVGCVIELLLMRAPELGKQRWEYSSRVSGKQIPISDFWFSEGKLVTGARRCEKIWDTEDCVCVCGLLGAYTLFMQRSGFSILGLLLPHLSWGLYHIACLKVGKPSLMKLLGAGRVYMYTVVWCTEQACWGYNITKHLCLTTRPLVCYSSLVCQPLSWALWAKWCKVSPYILLQTSSFNLNVVYNQSRLKGASITAFILNKYSDSYTIFVTFSFNVRGRAKIQHQLVISNGTIAWFKARCGLGGVETGGLELIPSVRLVAVCGNY